MHYDSEAHGISGGREDRAPDEVHALLWGTYSDFGSQHIGDLGPEAGRAFRQAAAFLRTDLVYEWSDTRPVFKHNLLRVIGAVVAIVAGLPVAIGGISVVAGLALVAIGFVLAVVGWWVSPRVKIEFEVWPFANEPQMRAHMGADG